MNRVVIMCVGLVALAAPVAASADSFGIQVLGATCSASASASGYGFSPITQTTTTCGSSVSVDVDMDDPFVDAHASAVADLFGVAADSRAFFTGVFSDSSADTLLSFAPLTNGIALLGIEVSSFNSFYTDKSISLYDVTAQTMLWAQTWHGFGSAGSFELPFAFDGTFNVSTAFDSTHTYELQMHVDGDSVGDHTAGGFQVRGLVAVPEPSSLLLFGTGLAGVEVFKRARTRSRS